MTEKRNGSNIKLPIYLDNQATTPVDPRVLEAMMPFFKEKFGNPHSRSHSYGWEVEEAVEEARGEIATIIGANPKEVIYTSGATESNNLAIKGVANFYKDRKNHIVTVLTEHKVLLDSLPPPAAGRVRGHLFTGAPNGLIDLEQLRDAITDQTSLVSIMGVNNEIGVIQPLAEIGKICREKGVFFHTDCAQAVGKIPLDVNEMNIDLMSISGHKIYGPMGIGALYVRRRPRVRLQALINGGGQERGMRSGTLPAPLCVGLGEACRVAREDMPAESERIRMLAQKLHNGVNERIPDVILNGDPETALCRQSQSQLFLC